MRPIEDIDYPKTAEEWWALLEHHKEPLKDLTVQFHPVYRQMQRVEMRITAPLAERVCEGARRSISRECDEDPLVRFDRLLEEKSDEMVSLLNEVWFGMPESTDCWQYPVFGVLCNLCSEGYVLGPEPEGIEE